MRPEEVQDQLRILGEQASEFFTEAGERLAAVPAEDPYPMGRDADYFWGQLSEELQATSESLVAGLLRLVPEVIPAVLSSPALTEADHRDVGFGIMELRAALRLRRYRHWNIEV